MGRPGSRAVVEGQENIFPGLGLCFYIPGDFFTVDGAGEGGDFMVQVLGVARKKLQ